MVAKHMIPDKHKVLLEDMAAQLLGHVRKGLQTRSVKVES